MGSPPSTDAENILCPNQVEDGLRIRNSRVSRSYNEEKVGLHPGVRASSVPGTPEVYGNRSTISGGW